MNKEQVREMLLTTLVNAKEVFRLICIIITLTIVGFILLGLNKFQDTEEYISYTEKSDLDYKVYLKENNFFKTEYLPKDNQYISSLIDKINAEFKYHLSFEQYNMDYNYSYNIIATVSVKDSQTKNNLYEFNEELVPEQLLIQNASSSLDIEKNIDIDYNHYNDLIKDFKTEYNLNNAISTLELKMNVKLLGNNEELKDINKTSVTSISIPLTENTIAIDMNYDLVDNDSNYIVVLNKNKSISSICLTFAIIIFTADFLLVAWFVKLLIDTRTAEDIYHKQLKKILTNYKSHIQKINNDINLSNYQLVNVDTFNEILEIKETLQEPLLMFENKPEKHVKFFVPSKEKFIYIYELKIEHQRN